jgi:hypothetical protein
MYVSFNILTKDSSYKGAGIAQSVQRRVTGRTAGARFPTAARDFSLLHSVQVGSGSYSSSHPIGPEDKVAEA